MADVDVTLREEDNVDVDNVTVVELEGDFIKFKRGDNVVAAFGMGYVVGFVCDEEGTLEWRTKT